MPPTLILHGGAGTLSSESRDERKRGLRRAFDTAWAMLWQGGSAVDVVVHAVVTLEENPIFNAGVGSCLNQDGNIEMDASLMDGARWQTGAVGAVRCVRNPILLAKAVMEASQHVFLASDGAERFARMHGLTMATQEDLLTERQLQQWQMARTGIEPGTVGAVAVDCAGHTAAATSTGGVFNKLPGRIGDSAIIGAGTYADDCLGAASATGNGEAIIRSTMGRTVVEMLRDGRDPRQAAQTMVALLSTRTGGEAGLIVLDALGRAGYAYNTQAMSVAFLAGETVVIESG
jgi:L-asparaginase / beta-aspartyl-peptidase